MIVAPFDPYDVRGCERRTKKRLLAESEPVAALQ
jgi:hypothetical protein